jgi:hypothetical protein
MTFTPLLITGILIILLILLHVIEVSLSLMKETYELIESSPLGIDVDSPQITNANTTIMCCPFQFNDLNVTTESPRPYEPNPRPLLEDIVRGWNVTGNPQWLLNFAITGFPKCGTSSLMHYFYQNPEVQMHKKERCDIGANQHVALIRDLYNFPPGDYVRGLKCPRDLENKMALTNYMRYFPNTDLIIGIRHPIKWFESFYNHRVQNNFRMNISLMQGSCGKYTHGVCTHRASFHVNLAMLGKSPRNDDERALMPSYTHRYLHKFHLKGRVFLYELEQLNERNETRALIFRRDLQTFLYLKKELPPMVWFRPGHKNIKGKRLRQSNAKKLNICDRDHKSLRKVLMSHAINASKWIRHHFLSSSDVHVSSPAHFENLLQNWRIDPCAEGDYFKARI